MVYTFEGENVQTICTIILLLKFLIIFIGDFKSRKDTSLRWVKHYLYDIVGLGWFCPRQRKYSRLMLTYTIHMKFGQFGQRHRQLQ